MPETSSALPLITSTSLDALSEQAKASPRLRKNFNFHSSNEAACHRLLNALEPGTYIQPHRHLGIEKDETMIVVRGRFGVLIFDDEGGVLQQFVLGAEEGNYGVTIPLGRFHSMVALESGSVFFESKAGPYAPITAEEKASWAPSEGEATCASFLEKMRAYFPA
ncbi:MAG: WbuC family cupin fold metalloprotein [Burkholderiaceae bacterium]|nr:WbuC family cupin fold metalloprotein [Burkholderiaceae bacterium]